MKELYLRVFGIVQGVFFRANTKKEADKLGLNGHVRNMPDGSVEIVAQGDEEALKKLVEWSSHGPEEAEVKKLEYHFREPADLFDKFEICY